MLRFEPDKTRDLERYHYGMVTNEVTSEVTSENRIFRTCTPIKKAPS